MPNHQNIVRDPAENLAVLSAAIGRAAKAAGRRADDICLIAISKRQPMERIQSLVRAGQRHFGENKVQEAAGHWSGRRDDIDGLTLHMVGPIQSNKVGDIFDLFDVVHSLDRDKLAHKFAAERDRRGHCPELFIQVNTGEEPQKSGVLPDDLDRFVDLCRGSLALPVTGLMCLPPVDEEPALHFALLEKLAARHNLANLSMGMSDDFETAIEFGATHIRLGSALLGPRQEPGV